MISPHSPDQAELDNDDQHNENTESTGSMSRRSFLKAGLGVAGVVTVGAVGSIIADKNDPRFRDNLTSAATRISSLIPYEPEFADTNERQDLFETHIKDFGISNEDWMNSYAENLDRLFNYYFQKPLKEGIPVLVDQLKVFKNDPRLLIHALSGWGYAKVNSKFDVGKEELTNLAQTAFNGNFEWLDSWFEGRPIREYMTESGQPLDFIPIELRHRSHPAIRTVGLKDNSPDAYARAIAVLSAKDPDVAAFWDPEVLELSQNLTRVSRRMYSFRRANNTNETPHDVKFLTLSSEFEKMIVNRQRELNFGLALFTATLKFNEDLLAHHLGIENYDGLSEVQMKAMKVLILLSMDDYPAPMLTTGGNPNRRLDGQYTLAEDIIPSTIDYFQKFSGFHPLDNYSEVDLDKGLAELTSFDWD